MRFYLINSWIENSDREALSNLWKDIFVVLFCRLQSSKMTKFVKGLIVCFCLFAGMFGGEHLMQIVDSIQPKLFAMVLEKVVIPEAQKVSGPTERKITAVGIIKLLTETPSMLAEPYVNLWTHLLRCLISLFEMPEDDSIPDDEHFNDLKDTPGYQTAFAQLALWAAKNRIPLALMSPTPRHTRPNPCISYLRSILANSVPSSHQDWMLNRSSSCRTICKLQTFQPFFNHIHLFCVYRSVQLLKLHKSQANLCYAFSVFC